MATVKKTKAQIEAEAKKAKAAAAKKTATPKPVAPVITAEAAETGINLQHLTHIVTATTGPAGFCFTPADVNGPLVAAGLVDIKADVVDANGHIATKANATGIEYVAKAAGPFGGAPAAAPAAGAWSPEVQQTIPGVPAAPAATQHNTTMAVPATRTMTKPPEGGFKVVVGIAPPPLVREFGTRQSVYPFESMVVGGSFFVAATEQRPKPAKSLASTVNSATARFAVEDGVDAEGNPKFKKTRKFSLRAVAADTTWPDGSTGGAPWGFPGQAGAMVSRIE